jgi:hypothetical protein
VDATVLAHGRAQHLEDVGPGAAQVDVEDLARIEAVLTKKKALVVDLTPELRFEKARVSKGKPRYRWTRTSPR